MKLNEITKKVYSQFNHHRPLSEFQQRDIRHMKRTAAISLDLAYEMKELDISYDSELTEEYIKKLQLAASHHDYMKMIWPDVMRDKKKDVLSGFHKNIIKSHPICSGENLRNDLKINYPELSMYFDKEVYSIILHHHEHHNGSGYPDKLSEDEIPLGARILHVADAYDAMRSKRLYRRKENQRMEHERAVAIIKEKKGIEFHPAVVDAFMNVPFNRQLDNLYDHLIILKEQKTSNI
ncbi:HD domain-containing protein [Candidatus Woesearchaeota archaeon]|nr:HD domain-containing protein [Candidatus Woesearchaeota archaeon]